eukprot:TRINITY_DN4897_c1_g1_i1.p1 TRINITY_DN4897_c1_g1~~TRINITY_DN4897_c1_g1_i1.p1  ORF type:complete len:317 (+),score=29.20 TRINITY_DN4897_c1_g1_i1:101-1051(+)
MQLTVRSAASLSILLSLFLWSQCQDDQGCVDISPSELYDCAWYQQWNTCPGLDSEYCNVTCGTCCTDKLFPGLTCEFVKSNNLCGISDVVDNKYCEKTCEACGLPSVGIILELYDSSQADIIKKFFEKTLDIDPVQGLTGQNACGWMQVSCNDDGEVTRLDFNYFLQGFPDNANSIPPEVSMLQFLQTLQMQENYLVGSLPPEMSVLTNLYRIDLSDNIITGTLPPELSEIAEIERFDVYINQISGTLPEEYSVWGEYGSVIWVDNNRLSGTIPEQYSEFSTLNFDAFPQDGDLCMSESSSSELVAAVDDFSDEFC